VSLGLGTTYRAAMHLVGLTGGIGSGKSAVSRLLASYGAVVLDADVMAREVVEVGTPGLAEVVEAFGSDVLRPDGSLERARLGQRVFGDADELARLNEILRPRIGQRFDELLAQAEASGEPLVVHDIALLVENGLQDRYDAIVVVAATPQTQLDRLVRLRGMDEAEARARIAAQASLEDRLAVATHVITNDGPLDVLAPQVEQVWAELLAAAEDGRQRT
jgi:dephospho-CoA kinase